MCVGRPRKSYDETEALIIKEAYLQFKFGAGMLEVVIKKTYKLKIIIESTCISCLRGYRSRAPINRSVESE